jgi:protein gp37
MYEMDKNYGRDSSRVTQTRSGFRLPVQRVRIKDNKRYEKYELEYKVPSGSHIMTCLSSDFFIEEADIWRKDAWNYIHERSDCLFEIITKRPERIEQCLPDNWLDGWHNVIIDVTTENENRAWERVPILLDLPIKHMGIVIEPMLEQMDIRPYLSSGLIEHVSVGGESYMGYDGLARELDLAWVKDIQQQCIEYEVPFSFHQTGTRLKVDNNKIISVTKKSDQYGLAEFYGYDIEEAGGINWKATAEELELRALAESAHNIYKQLELSDFGI